MCKKLIYLVLAMAFCLTLSAQAFNIIWVSDNKTPSGGIPADQGWVNLLRAQGHIVDYTNVTVGTGYWNNIDTDATKLAALNAADLIIVSRDLNSGSYANNATELTRWNTDIKKPVLLLMAHMARSNGALDRWRWLSNTGQNDVTPTLQAVATAHPIFSGVTLDGSNQVNILTANSSISNATGVGNGTLIARRADNSQVWIAEWPTGVEFYSGSGYTTGARRMLFCAGGIGPDGGYNLNANGEKMFLNAVNYLLPQLQSYASNPSPAAKATDVPRDVVLSWKLGIFANTHDVYFGTDTTAVQNANTNDASGIYRGRKPKDPTSYDPPETLNFSKIYYWRVDEVNGPSDYTIYTGSVWSFTAEPFAYRITPIAATASSSYSIDMGPGKTIDGSGLNANDQHSTTDTTMWLSDSSGPQPTWIQYEFDRAYKLYEMWVWNSNQSVEPAVGFGLKDVTIQYSTDGANWTQLSGVPQFAQATGFDTYVHNTTVNFQGVAARYVKITANSNWGGSSLYGLSEVRFFQIPVRAREPSPALGATGVGLDNIVLSWRPGREAVSHKVYFSTNSNAVISGAALVGTVGTNSYNLSSLELGRTYYWKIDEVNLAATPTTWQGDLWRFTTRDNFVVEDFESYTNSDPNIIFKTWKDGVGYSPGNGTGSQAGYRDPNYAELTIIHGGRQSMPVDYNNTKSPFYSEADRTFAPTQDWTAYGVNLLSLWLRGYPASVGSFAETPPGSGIYTMTAFGADIWNVPDARRPSKGFHDEFRYAYIQVSGNYAIAAKVESITNTNAWAKAGVMIRDSLDANSAHVMACLTPSTTNGIAFQHRAIAGGTSTADINIPNINPPYWIDLERDGDTFKSYYSLTGAPDSWVPLGSTTVTMTDPVYIGLSLTSHNTAAACTAVFSNVSLAPSVTPSWTSRDIGIKSNVAAPLYVTLKDSNARTATITHDDPNIALATAYQEWLIPLARFTSLNSNLDLANIQKITLGIGGAGSRGAGTLYFDDIRLYGSRCASGRPGPAGDFTSDCFVDYNDLNTLTNNWLINPSSVNSCLEAYYRFEGDFQDSSGHNLHGDPCGSPTLQAGAVGSLAVNLWPPDGNDYVNCKNPPSLDFGTGNWSVCAWIKTAQSGINDPNKGNIFSKGGDSTNGIRYALGMGEVTSGRVTLTTDDNGAVEADAKRQVTSTFAVNDNVWHHVVGMRDGSTLRLYVDGLLNGTNTLIAGYNLAGTFQHNAYVGTITNHSNGTLYKFYRGLIDDVRVYSRALSRAEIEYLAGKPKIDISEDGTIDFRDYAFLADTWLEDLFWPPLVTNIWAYEFKNDANCYDPGPPTEARDLHLEFNGAVYLIDTGPFTSFAGNGTSKITLSGGVVAANRSTVIRVGTTGAEKTLNKWWWTDATHQRISKEMTGVGPSCKKIN